MDVIILAPVALAESTVALSIMGLFVSIVAKGCCCNPSRDELEVTVQNIEIHLTSICITILYSVID